MFLSWHLLFSKNESLNLRGAGLCFTPNKGQVIDVEGNLRPDILYTGDGGGLSLFIRNTGVSYVMSKPAEANEFMESFEVLMPKTSSFYTHRIDLNFLNCNTNTLFIETDEVEGYKNFYYPHCAQGVNNIKSYNVLTQKNIYNNIDVIYKGSKSKGLKYDIIVNPGGDYRNIALQYSGTNSVSLKEGRLIISTSLNELTEYIPKVYQNIDGKIVDVAAEYFLHDNIINFKLGTFNPKHPLIIDPWVTYFGGANNENGTSIATDPNGDIVFTGLTYSNNFPVLGAFQSTQPAGAFVAKMNANGNLLWCTYYGGTYNDRGNGICTDSNGDVYFTGESWSTNNFPIVTTFGQTSHLNTHPGITSGKTAAFLVKLSSGTGQPIWGTFYGDPISGQYTTGQDVTVDQNNNVLISGHTAATANIATPGTFQSNYGGAGVGYFWGDVYVAKFNSTGVRQWGTYCGGSDVETAGGISCDLSNNIYVAGKTLSNDFPVSSGAFSTRYSNNSDAFLFKLDQTGQRVWGTYYGGPSAEEGLAVQVDLTGNVYIAGRTLSKTALGTAGAAYPTKTAGSLNSDAFITKFSSAGSRLWGSYLGGSAAVSAGGGAADYATGLAIDGYNNVIVAGDTYSTDFPVTSCAQQTVFIGTEDQFITTFDPNGNIICSGYLGMGNSSSYNNETMNGSGGCIAATGGFLYLTAASDNAYPVTINAYQYNSAGNVDVTVAKFCVTSCGLPTILADFYASKTNICTGEPINFSLTNTSCSQTGTTYLWSFSGGTPSTSTNQNPANISFNGTGTYNVKVVIETPCGKDSVEKNNYITVHGIPATINPVSNVTCNGYNDGTANVNAPAGQYNFSWSNGQTSSTATGLSAGTYSVTVSENNGCSTTFTTIITQPLPLILTTAINDSISCNGYNDGTVIASCSGGTPTYNYLWSNNQTNTIATSLSTGLYNVIVTDENGCTITGSIQISDPQALVVSIAPNVPVCEGQTVTLSASSNGGSPAYLYNWSNGSTFAMVSVTPSSNTTYSLEVTDKNGCSASAITNIEVNPLPEVIFASDETEGCAPLCISFINTSPTSLNSSWQFGNGSSSGSEQTTTCFNTAGQYNTTLTVTDANGCSNTKTENNYITVYPNPSAAFTANSNPTDINIPVVFTDQSTDATKWNWTFGDVVNTTSSAQHPSISYSDSGYYRVILIVENSYGCVDTTEQLIRVQPEFSLYAPNSFTPNNDGTNDLFKPKGTGIDYTNYELYIFDRWGNKIFFTDNPEKGWNGCVKNSNTIAQIDTYVWVVYLRDVNGNKHSHNGHINLIK